MTVFFKQRATKPLDLRFVTSSDIDNAYEQPLFLISVFDPTINPGYFLQGVQQWSSASQLFLTSTLMRLY